MYLHDGICEDSEEVNATHSSKFSGNGNLGRKIEARVLILQSPPRILRSVRVGRGVVDRFCNLAICGEGFRLYPPTRISQYEDAEQGIDSFGEYGKWRDAHLCRFIGHSLCPFRVPETLLQCSAHNFGTSSSLFDAAISRPARVPSVILAVGLGWILSYIPFFC